MFSSSGCERGRAFLAEEAALTKAQKQEYAVCLGVPEGSDGSGF